MQIAKSLEAEKKNKNWVQIKIDGTLEENGVFEIS